MNVALKAHLLYILDSTDFPRLKFPRFPAPPHFHEVSPFYCHAVPPNAPLNSPNSVLYQLNRQFFPCSAKIRTPPSFQNQFRSSQGRKSPARIPTPRHGPARAENKYKKLSEEASKGPYLYKGSGKAINSKPF
ncbi:hypothetical protein Zmor_019708 [Zophobas morio]|uniref:Uncharacterized protein n=1 Tax=Zophobas morio TaxID=2755281 RepID=A0AA38M8M5_9CUCU|nr:hypothetical protein Zmor_019708 [Zophobas morio]